MRDARLLGVGVHRGYRDDVLLGLKRDGIGPVFQEVVPLAVPLPPRSFTQLTIVTVELLVAEPASVTVFAVVLELPVLFGVVMLTTNGEAATASRAPRSNGPDDGRGFPARSVVTPWPNRLGPAFNAGEAP